MDSTVEPSATWKGEGQAGNVNIVAGDAVAFDGESRKGNSSGAFRSVEQTGVGKGGDIDIITGSLFVTNNAVLNARSLGQGNAGSLKVTANSVLLDNQGQLIAETASGEGGNIRLQVEDLLLMRHNSLISAQAGNNGNGGNIDIKAGFIVAVPRENSDITANAFKGRGGNINIAAQGIYGIEFRPRLTRYSDITASSDFGIDGVVDINTLDIDPVRGIVNLPSEPVNNEVTQECQVSGGKASGSFINTGRGGLPTNPYEPLDSSDILADVQPPTQWTSSSAGTASSSSLPKTNPERIVEATGWIINENGEVLLVAEIPPTPSQWGCRLR